MTEKKFSWKVKAPVIAIGAVIGAILYRMGGSGNFPRQARVIGVPVLSALVLALLSPNWWIILTIPLMIGAISTYWKKKGSDATFINYFLHGLGIALSALPFAIASGHYVGFGIRLIVLPLAIAFWSMWINWDILEEGGRGFLIVATLPLLLI